MVTTLKSKNVITMPETMKPGVLYISKEYKLAIHLCPCGCGLEVVMSFEEGEWRLATKAGKPTLTPSVSNRTCKSHYWITEGEIKWV